MRLKELHAELGALIGEGLGRKQVCIDKATFHHNCENDGVTILDVESIEVQWVPLSDDDGGVATTKAGLERGSSCIVLYGSLHTPLNKRNGDRYRASADGFCANCKRGVTAHEPITGSCNMGITNRSTHTSEGQSR
jgi:hypothetical protein